MFTHYKLKSTAGLIVLAFIFRLLFVNINAFAAPETTQVRKQSPHSLRIERRRTEDLARSESEKYTAVEICEERPDNEENLSPVLYSFFYSFLSKLVPSTGSNTPFDSIKCCLHPKKYLSLSILRI